MTTYNLINICRQTEMVEHYGDQLYWDISRAKQEYPHLPITEALQKMHDDFRGFSGEEFTKQRKQQILNAIQFLKDYSDNVNLGNMTISFVEY